MFLDLGSRLALSSASLDQNEIVLSFQKLTLKFVFIKTIELTSRQFF